MIDNLSERQLKETLKRIEANDIKMVKLNASLEECYKDKERLLEIKQKLEESGAAIKSNGLSLVYKKGNVEFWGYGDILFKKVTYQLNGIIGVNGFWKVIRARKITEKQSKYFVEHKDKMVKVFDFNKMDFLSEDGKEISYIMDGCEVKMLTAFHDKIIAEVINQ